MDQNDALFSKSHMHTQRKEIRVLGLECQRVADAQWNECDGKSEKENPSAPIRNHDSF